MAGAAALGLVAAPGVGAVAAGGVAGAEVAAVFEVVLRRAEEVGAAGDDVGVNLGEGVQDLAAAVAGG
jgi:hypothetical protein